MSLTLRKVNKVIKNEVGNFNLVKGRGYFYITSDNVDLSLKLSALYSTSIFVYALNHQTLEEWIKDVKNITRGI